MYNRKEVLLVAILSGAFGLSACGGLKVCIESPEVKVTSLNKNEVMVCSQSTPLDGTDLYPNSLYFMQGLPGTYLPYYCRLE